MGGMVMCNLKRDEPVFPLVAISLLDEAAWQFSSIEEIGHQLEVGGEWDTDDPQYAQEMLILDYYNRRVRLKVSRLRVERCELYDPEPLSEDEISQMVKEARKRASQSWHRRKQGQALWRRFRKWLRGH